MATDRVPVAPETLTVGQTAVLSREVTVAITAVQVGARQVAIQGTVQGDDDNGQTVTVRVPKGAPTATSRARAWLVQERPPAGSLRRLADGSVWCILSSGGALCITGGTVYGEYTDVPWFFSLGDPGVPVTPGATR